MGSLHGPEASALDAFGDHLFDIGAFDGIGNLGSAAGGAVNFGEVEAIFDEFWGGEWAGAVVNGDIFAAATIDGLEAIPDGDVAFVASANDLGDFFKGATRDEGFDFVHMFIFSHDEDFADLATIVESFEGMPEDGFSCEMGEKFVEAHATTASSGDDNSTDHRRGGVEINV